MLVSLLQLLGQLFLGVCISFCKFLLNGICCFIMIFICPRTVGFIQYFSSKFLFCICSYGRAKDRYSRNGEEKLSPGFHLASAAEAGALVSTSPYYNCSALVVQKSIHACTAYRIECFSFAFHVILGVLQPSVIGLWGFQVSLCTNPIWVVKTRFQLQTPFHQTRPYSGLYGLLHIFHQFANYLLSEIVSHTTLTPIYL